MGATIVLIILALAGVVGWGVVVAVALVLLVWSAFGAWVNER